MSKKLKIKVIYLNNPIKSSLGLTVFKKARPVMLKTRFGIHTFGMKYAIDVIILNKHFEVVRLKEKLQPNNIFIWVPIYNTVLELPWGYINENKIILMQKIEIVIS